MKKYSIGKFAEKIEELKSDDSDKCEKYGILFVKADRWFPSSKMCSNCGNVKKDLELSDRMYYCDCEHCMDRDVNASINLANYIV